MSDTPVSVLLVADDRDLAGRLASAIFRRGYQLSSAVSVGDVPALVADGTVTTFDVVVVGLTVPTADDVAAIRLLATQEAGAPIVVALAASHSDAGLLVRELSPLIRIVHASDDELLAGISRAIRTGRADSLERRLVWELQIVNEIADVVSRSLELGDVLTAALQRLIPALDLVSGSIRLRNDLSGEYELKAAVGPARVRTLVDRVAAAVRPSDRVIATRRPVIVEDFTQLVETPADQHWPIRSGVSVPMFANDELIGTLSVGAARPHRFDSADQRLLAIIAGQIGAAVQNARLHDYVRRGKREWEQTFDAISEPIAVFDGQGALLRGNTALAAVLGRSVTDIRQTTCRDIGFCGGTCPHCAVGNALSRGAANRAEITLADGQIFSVTTFPMGSGEGPSVVQVAKNVTEEIRSARRLRVMSDELAVANTRLKATVEQLKSTQAQLLQAEKLSAIGQLVAGVAHELNNPLTSVIGYAQLLEEELLGTGYPETMRPLPELARDMRRISEESERAARIVRNLLAFARRQAAARAPQDIVELITRVLSLRAYELRLNTIELRTEFEPHLPKVLADSSQVQQALLNLILNAEQAMRGRASRRLTVAARFDEESSAVVLSVTDTGHGIDTVNLTRIFDPFFTTREVGEGTGLGLSICYGIVRDHGGQILVESRMQAGTTFSILLPAMRATRAERAEEVLVAYADQGDRDFITAALVAWGYNVTGANGSDDALARYQRGGLHAALVDRDLLAADVAAWSASRSGSARPVPLIIIGMTTDEGEIDRFGREHASVILTPPFQLRALYSAVREVSKEYV
jgi:two-component system NtrC family sensor kinase